MKTEILNAKIKSTKLGEERGCLTADIFCEGDGWCCGFGGYCLDRWDTDTETMHSTDGYGAIIALMKTLEVGSWEQLTGQFVRVEIEGWGGRILRIGHLMKDQWFSWERYFNKVEDQPKQSL